MGNCSRPVEFNICLEYIWYANLMQYSIECPEVVSLGLPIRIRKSQFGSQAVFYSKNRRVSHPLRPSSLTMNIGNCPLRYFERKIRFMCLSESSQILPPKLVFCLMDDIYYPYLYIAKVCLSSLLVKVKFSIVNAKI